METNEEKLALLRAAVAAKVTYWDALREIEEAYGHEDGNVSDRSSDALEDLVSGFASDMDQSTAWINIGHVTALDEAMAK